MKILPESRGRAFFYAIVLAVALPLLYFLFIRGLSFYQVDARSMLPTLHPFDHLLTMDAQEYERGDIVVLRDPQDKSEVLVKRIVGIAGDTVESRGGALFVNGHYASEPYTAEPMEYHFDPYEVPEGHVFVLGDNRNFSVDSHSWGPAAVPLENVLGSARFIYLPVERARRLDSYPLRNTVGK